MLNHLLIQNFAIIEDLNVDFNDGFISLTGETGAGKSIIIDALNMLCGSRSSFEKIRNGKSKAFIEGTFIIKDKNIKKLCEDIIDDVLEDNTLIISRSIDINGKTTVKINNHTVLINVLKEITPYLIDIHSQQKDADYLKEDKQLYLLDEYCKKIAKKDIFNDYDVLYKEYKSTLKEIDSLNKTREDIGSLDYLTYQLNELDKVNIQPHEMEDLEEEKIKLNSLTKASEHIVSFLEEYKQASTHLYNAKKSLDMINDETFNQYSEKYNENYFNIEDVFSDIEEKFSSYQDSLSRLEQINDRLYTLHGLRKKYGYTSEDILNSYQSIKENIYNIANFDKLSEDLENKKFNQETSLNKLCKELHELRLEGANRLEMALNQELKDLYLENAKFKIDFTDLNDFSANGKDKIEFKLSANIGSPFLSLAKTASLGETSRLNLALKTIFNALSPKEVIIFDEIDIGVSGRVGEAIALKMKEISKSSQVITISHLPIVCAKADYHYFVEKEVRNGETYSSIRLLTNEERITEIAKMISASSNKESLEMAKILLNQN